MIGDAFLLFGLAVLAVILKNIVLSMLCLPLPRRRRVSMHQPPSTTEMLEERVQRGWSAISTNPIKEFMWR